MSINQEWTDQATGLRCMALLSQGGHKPYWCGYVAVARGHPLFRIAYNDAVPDALAAAAKDAMESPIGKRGIIPVLLSAHGGPKVDALFDVHGSLTFSGIDKRDEGLWWFGFDCAHDGDNIDVQNEAYVRNECASLARQLSGIAEIAQSIEGEE